MQVRTRRYMSLPPSCLPSRACRVEGDGAGAPRCPEFEQTHRAPRGWGGGEHALLLVPREVACPSLKHTRKLGAFHKFTDDESTYYYSCTKRYLFPPDPLLPPTLHCTLTNDSIYVGCEMPRDYRRHREQLLYTWRCPSPQCRGSPELGAPDPLKLRFTKESDLPQEVHCFVENVLSKRMSSMVLSTCIPGGEYTAARPVAEMLYSSGVHGPVVVCGSQTTGTVADVHFTNSKREVSYNVHGHPLEIQANILSLPLSTPL